MRFLLLALLLPLAVPATAQDSTVVYLVRHAEKEDPTAVDPPLSAAGRERAAALAERLARAGVTTVIVTQYERTGATAAPFVAASGIVPRVVPTRGGALPHPEAVAALLAGELRGGTVLVVGHNSTTPATAALLGGPRFPPFCEEEYAHLFVLVLREGEPPRFRRESYGRPDAATAALCAPQ
jgi:2,3-bisphosphoglycerate-dependent phosphoglycerate mutase